jgi:hypothetical protein
MKKLVKDLYIIYIYDNIFIIYDIIKLLSKFKPNVLIKLNLNFIYFM